jgi:hypothetical protein
MKPQTEKRNIKVTNPYSGQSAMLTQSEAIHYNMIKAFEKREEYELMQQGLDKFSRLNPEGETDTQPQSIHKSNIWS